MSPRAGGRRDRNGRTGLILVLAAAVALPWAVGGTPMWAYRAAAFLVVAGCVALVWKGGPRVVGLHAGSTWLWPAAALALIAAFQATPLPLGLLRAASPAAAEAWGGAVEPPGGPEGSEAVTRLEREAIAAVPEAAASPVPAAGAFHFPAPSAGDAARPTVSYHPAGTRERLGWYLSLLAAFLIVREAAASRTGRRWIRTALLADFVLLAAAAMFLRVAAPGTVMGLVEPHRGGNPYGPYVNPSHFAFLMELAVPWFAALAWQARRDGMALRSSGVAVPAIGAALCALAAIGSASKGAAVLIPLALAALVLAAPGRIGRKLVVVATGAVALIAASAVAGWTTLGTRIADFLSSWGGGSLSSSDRLLVWRYAIGEVLRSHPVFGIGFGAFRYVIPRALPPGEAEPWLQLHNDFLEVLVSGGWVGATLLLVLAIAFWRRAIADARGAGSDRAERLGVLAGLGAVTAHGTFDFGHQIPANALIFVVLAATAVPTRSDPPSSAPRSGATLWRSLALALLVVAAIFAFRGVVGGAAYSAGLRMADRGDYVAAAAELDRGAIGGNRFEALWMGGDVRLGVWDRLGVDSLAGAEGERLAGEAADRFLAADREVAGSGWTLAGLAAAYRRAELADAVDRTVDLAWIGHPSWAQVGRYGRIAVGLGRLAVAREPAVAEHRDAIVETYLSFGLRQEAIGALREAARVQPLLETPRGFDSDALDDEMRTAFYEGAKDALGSAPMARPVAHLLSLGKTAFRLGRYDESRLWFEKVLEGPSWRMADAEARFWLGLAAERSGHPEQAKEYFESVQAVPNFRLASLDWLARLAERRGDWREAVRSLETLRRESPNRSAVVSRWARAKAELGEIPPAIEVVRAELQRNPGDTDLLVTILELQLQAGDLDSARRSLRSLEEDHPDDPRIPDLRRRLDDPESGR